MGYNLSNLLYLVTIVTFILALRFLSSPAHARRGNQIGAAGMLVAIAVTFARSGLTSYWAIALGRVIGGGFGAVAARRHSSRLQSFIASCRSRERRRSTSALRSCSRR